MTQQQKQISSPLLFGSIAGVWLIIFGLGTYLAGPSAFVGNLGYLAYAVVIGLAIAATIVEKNREAGIIAFQPAVRTAFIVFVIALAAQTVFVWVLMHWVDPKFSKSLEPMIIAKNEALERWINISEDQIRANTVASRGQDPFPPGGMLMGLARFYIVCFLISIVIAAIFKTPGKTTTTRPTGL